MLLVLLAMRADACETGSVIVVPLETWVSIGSLLIVTLTLAVFMRSTVTSAEERLGKRIDAVEASLEKLDDRVYALAVGIKPLLEADGKNSASVTRRPA